jgi:hypothetical protein
MQLQKDKIRFNIDKSRKTIDFTIEKKLFERMAEKCINEKIQIDRMSGNFAMILMMSMKEVFKAVGLSEKDLEEYTPRIELR